MSTLPPNRLRIHYFFAGLIGIFVLIHVLFYPIVYAQDTSERTDWISQRAYLDDPSGKLKFTDVLAQKFTPFDGYISRGNSDKPLWLKLDVPAHDSPDLVLTIEPPHLQEVDIYTQDAQGRWTESRTGSKIAFEKRPRSELYFAHDLVEHPTQATSIYVRLKSPTLMIPRVEVVSSRASHTKDNLFHIGMSAYIALCFLAAIVSLAAWRFSGDKLWLIAVAHELISMLVLSNMTGFSSKYFLAASPDVAIFLLPLANILSAAVAYFFYWRLLKAFSVQRWIYRTHAVFFAALCIPLALLVLGLVKQALLINNLLILASAAFLLTTLWIIDLRDSMLTLAYRVFIFILSVYCLTFWLPVLQVLSPSALNMYPATPASLLTMGMLVVILGRRLYLQILQGRRAELLKTEAQKDLRIEEAKHAGTAGLLGMILHEVKNPLTSIRMATSTLSSGQLLNDADRLRRLSNIQRAIDGIDLVLESCTAVDKLERGQLQLDPQPEEVVGFLKDWLVDTYDTEPNGRLVLLAPQSLHATIDMRVWMLMVRNLVDNALKYSPEGSIIRLELSQPEGYLVLCVSNLTGKAGVPDADAVFSKYYRAPQAMGKPGTGLGLYWVNQVSAIMGGSVRMLSAVDTVQFELSTPC